MDRLIAYKMDIRSFVAITGIRPIVVLSFKSLQIHRRLQKRHSDKTPSQYHNSPFFRFDICSFYFSMSDSESSELVDSEAGLEEMEDEKLLSSDPEDNSNESSDEEELDEEENNVEEEFLEDSGEDEELSSEDEEEKKLTEDELRRIHLDDFSSDDEVWFEYC